MPARQREVDKDDEKEARGCRKKRRFGLTSWAASEDQLTDFIIDKDEQGVWEGAEPPVGPGKHTHTHTQRDENLIQRPQAWMSNMWFEE